jgi:hypothetical protein
MPGLYAEHLELLDPDKLPITFPSTISRDTALAAMKAAPSNAEVLAACKAAYQQHTNAVDSVTTGSISAAQAPELSGDIAAAHSYDWNSKVAAPSLTSPILTSTHMAGARGAVTADGDFATFFVGIEANIDVFVGGFGGIGVGVGFPSLDAPLWMAWGGMRISTNIDIAVNLDAGIFVEPPSEVAGDFLGIEVTCEPVYEGPSVGFGIHLSPDLSTIRGFSISVGVELGILPVNAAIEFGHIVTS